MEKIYVVTVATSLEKETGVVVTNILISVTYESVVCCMQVCFMNDSC